MPVSEPVGVGPSARHAAAPLGTGGTVNAQTCEQFRAALRAQMAAEFNKVARSARPRFSIHRLRYWQERLLEKLALALGAPVPTFDEFLAIFADAELMYEPPSAVPGVSDIVLRLGELERTLDVAGSEQWAAYFFSRCMWIDCRAEIAEYVVARLSRRALQALVQESVARLHPKYVENPALCSSFNHTPQYAAERLVIERAWAELFIRATR